MKPAPGTLSKMVIYQVLGPEVKKIWQQALAVWRSKSWRNDLQNLMKSQPVMSALEYVFPMMSLIKALFNGVIGNVLDPVKVSKAKKSLDFGGMVELFSDLKRLYEMAADNRTFASAMMGGVDVDALNDIGIDAVKLIQNGVDPGYLLAGAGTKFQRSDVSKKLGSDLGSFGVDSKKLSQTVSCTSKELLK